MVKFIFGRAGSGKSEYIIREIARLTSEGKRSCLIVPEPQTVCAETRLARSLPPSAALLTEATNFTRLSDSVSRRVGNLSYTKLTKGGKMLALWRAMISVFGGLTELSRISVGDETRLIPVIFAARRELEVAGVSPETLARAADELSEGGEDSAFAGRVSDLALVCAAYDSLTRDELGGAATPAERLAEFAARSEYFKDTAVFLDSFYSLTGAQYTALAEIIRCADSVTVTIPMESRNSDGIHLAAPRKFYESVLSAALRFGDGKPEIINLDGNRRASSAELYLTEKYLWDYSFDSVRAEKPTLPVKEDSVRVISASDRYEEAEAAAAFSAKFVREGGRYSDIAIVASDISVYRGILDTALQKHDIPCFISESSLIASSPAVRLILSLLKLPGRWRREDVTAIVKTGLTKLSDAEACALETYTEAWNIRGETMFGMEWTMNPDGYREEMSDRARETLSLANSAREKLVPALERFTSLFNNGEAVLRDVCTELVDFADREGIYTAILRRADKLEQSGRADDAERERLVWRSICEAFDIMTDIAGDVSTTASGAASLFRYAISDADTGAIPTGVDEVTLVSAAGLRTDGVRHVILLGAVAGEFPAVPQADNYFTSEDREKLACLGVSLGESTSVRASEELFRFYRAAAQASETLTVLVPQTTEGASRRISDGATRILDILGRNAPEPYRTLPTEERIFDKASLDSYLNSAEDAELRALRRELFGESEMRAQANTENITGAVASALFGERMSLTQSRIDTYVKCPMSYYCRYVLKLSEDRRAEISAPDIGTFVHAILERFFYETSRSDTPVSAAEADEICARLTEEYVKALFGHELTDERDGRMKYLFVRLRRQVTLFVRAIMEEAEQSRFEEYAAETSLGDADCEKSPPSITFETEGGARVSLYGRIDRLDVYRRDGETFIRVVDYKTGHASFSYEDVKLGLSVQLLLYLFAAWKSGGSSFEKNIAGDTKLLPAGALYCSVAPGELSSEVPLSAEEAAERVIKSITRSGIVSDDVDVLDAMESGVQGKFIPIKLKADGTPKKCASLASLERFGEMYRELEHTVCRIADEMRSGYSEAKPLERHGRIPCEWCKMKPICRREEK